MINMKPLSGKYIVTIGWKETTQTHYLYTGIFLRGHDERIEKHLLWELCHSSMQSNLKSSVCLVSRR